MKAASAEEVAAKAAAGFKVLQCQECAEKIKNALVAAGFKGQWIELRARSKRMFMVCLSYQGARFRSLRTVAI